MCHTSEGWLAIRSSFMCRTSEGWRKRLGVEPSPPASSRQRPVLKTGRTTGPPSLPLLNGGGPYPAKLASLRGARSPLRSARVGDLNHLPAHRSNQRLRRSAPRLAHCATLALPPSLKLRRTAVALAEAGRNSLRFGRVEGRGPLTPPSSLRSSPHFTTTQGRRACRSDYRRHQQLPSYGALRP
jgi:hypothetical protein